MNRVDACLLSFCLLLSGAVSADSPVLTEASGSGQVFRDCDSCPEMVVIPAGSFERGSPARKARQGSGEGPLHQVSIRSFAIGKTEVTQGQWKAIMGNNPSRFSKCGDGCPVERVSWKDAQEFIHRLNLKSGKTYRLPSDVEWQYACRAGSVNKYCGSEKIDSGAWYESNKTTHQVASRRPNAWGLYDMTGNVWEWTQDCDRSNYKAAQDMGGSEADDCKRHTLRGGSWDSFQRLANSTYRSGYPSKSRAYDIVSRRSDFGLRVAATLP
jgi:formylglycine-generating enzyme required for sulfatase activity